MATAAGSGNVIPFRYKDSLTLQIVELAFRHWRERLGLRHGSPKEDLLRARREVWTRVHRRKTTTGAPLFVVPRRGR